MRELTIVLVLIAVICTPFVIGSCDGTKSEPLYGVTAAGDGNGGVFLFYQNGDNGDVAVRKLSASGAWDWETVIDTAALDSAMYLSLDIVGDGNGSVFVAWPDTSEDQMRPVRHIARLGGNGNITWQRDFIYFRCMAAAADGAVFVAFDWSPIDFPDTGEDSICVVKIDSQGDYPWGIQGTGITTWNYHDNSLRLVGDDSGGATIIWEERERPAGLATGEPGMTHRIMTQHIDTDGSKVADNSVKLYETQENVWIDALQAAPDGLGGTVLSWFQVTEDPTAEPGHQQTWDVAVQRLDERWKTAWGTQPVSLDITEAAPDAHPMQPELCGDGAGGVVVIWRDTRHDETGEASIYAQKLDRDGSQVWNAGGIRVSSTSLNPHPLIDTGRDGSVVVAYSFESDGRELHLQKLDANGTAWAENGVIVTDSGFFRPCLVADGRGGAIIAWNTGGSPDKPGDTYIQRFDRDGSPLWGENGIDLQRIPANT